MGWTKRSAAVSLLLSMEEHRKQAGLRLVQLRESRGWSQEDLAQHAKLSVKTVSRFENGRHDGRRDTIRKLLKALEVDETTLLGEPPVPLGLGPTQLDRIELKLDELLSRLPDPAEEIERETAEAARQAALRGADSAASERKTRRSGKAR